MDEADRDSSNAHGEPSTASPPQRIGRYSIIRPLAGAHGFGDTYLGIAPDGHHVVIKVPWPGTAERSAGKERLQREAEALQRLAEAEFDDPRLIEIGTIDNRSYLVSQYVAGETLTEVVEHQGPLRGEALIRFAIEVASGLSRIHDAGLIHRDIKPQNVVLSPTGPKIIDFGVATKAEAINEEIIGTPMWMAPEQFAGERISAAADVYAWGCLVLFAATGRLPYPAESLGAMAFRIARQPLDLEGLPPVLVGPVRAATSKDPAARPTSMELVRMLKVSTSDQVSGGIPTEPESERRPHRPAEFGGQGGSSRLHRWPHRATEGSATDTTPASVPSDEGPASAFFLHALRRHRMREQTSPRNLESSLEAVTVRPEASSFANFLTALRRYSSEESASVAALRMARDTVDPDESDQRDLMSASHAMSQWATHTIEVLNIEELFEHEAAELYREAGERPRLDEGSA